MIDSTIVVVFVGSPAKPLVPKRDVVEVWLLALVMKALLLVWNLFNKGRW